MKFQFGKDKSNKNKIIAVSIVVSTLIAILSQCSKISEDNLWDLLDEIQRKYFPQTTLNEVILGDPDKVNRRIVRDINNALREYQELTGDDGTVRMPSPQRSEKPVDTSVCYTDECQSLGGEIRLCAPWLDDCPKE